MSKTPIISVSPVPDSVSAYHWKMDIALCVDELSTPSCLGDVFERLNREFATAIKETIKQHRDRKTV